MNNPNNQPDRAERQPLRELAERLDARTATHANVLLDPTQLMKRKAIDMDEFDQSPFIEPLADPRERRRAGLVRLGIGALLGITLTSATFVGLRERNRSDKKVGTTASVPLYLLKPTYVPAGLCLMYAGSMDDSSDLGAFQPTTEILTLKDANDHVVVINAGQQFETTGAVTGEIVDINGAKGTLSPQGDAKQLMWTRGKTGMSIMSTADRETTLAIARSIALTFDENGVHIVGYTATGFTADRPAGQQTYRGGGVSYSDCDVVPGQFAATPSIGVQTTADQMPFLFTGPAKETKTKVEIKRGDGSVPATKVTRKENGQVSTSLRWVERDNTIEATATKLDENELLKFVAGLQPADAADLRALGKTAKRPPTPGDPFPSEGPNGAKELATIPFGKSEVRIVAGVKDAKLCVRVEYDSGSGGGDCREADAEPKLQPAFVMGNASVFSTLAESSVTRGEAELPDGTKQNIPAFVDPRLPKVRVFVLVRTKDDPLPTHVRFYDAAGKVISEQ